MTHSAYEAIRPLDPEIEAEIDELAIQIEPVVRRYPRDTDRRLTRFESRRLDLLGSLLGHTPATPVDPLHVLGDSHTGFFAGTNRLCFVRHSRSGLLRPRWINRGLDLLPCFHSYHLGPSTAWMSAEPGSSTHTLEKVEHLLARHLHTGARVMLCFGEIDCRIHMPKAALAGQSIEELTSATADRFMRLARRVRELGFDTSVWGVAQVTPRPEDDPDAYLPAIGPVGLRLEITYAYNRALADICRQEDFPFADIAGTFHPPTEPMPEFCFIDGVHLSQSVMPHALRTLHDAGLLGF